MVFVDPTGVTEGILMSTLVLGVAVEAWFVAVLADAASCALEQTAKRPAKSILNSMFGSFRANVM